MHALCSMAGIRKIRLDDPGNVADTPLGDTTVQSGKTGQALPLASETTEVPPTEAVAPKGWWARVTRALHPAR